MPPRDREAEGVLVGVVGANEEAATEEEDDDEKLDKEVEDAA
jgi:hypothetical protein